MHKELQANETIPIVIKEVFFQQNNQVLLDIPHLHVNHGDRILLLGKNGCGKSTLLNTLAGLLSPQGLVSIFSTPAGSLSAKKKLSYLTQHIDYPPRISIKEIIDFVAAHTHNKINPITICQQFGLDPEKHAQLLSGGQKQRLALALAMLNQPKIVLLDEPDSGLDIQFREVILREMLNLMVNNQLTFIMVSHSFANLTEYFNRVWVMKSGKIITDISMRKFLQNTTTIHRWDIETEQHEQAISFCQKHSIPFVKLGEQLRIYSKDHHKTSILRAYFQPYQASMKPMTAEDIYFYYEESH
ncbi:MAG: ABC transporter ATP-binding protein [Legionellales bacterium]|nr:ABC transporter ATP-binding protein [Legionellales bacterium]